MARDNYDDWNISTRDKHEESFNLKGVSFVFLVSVLILTVTSIVNVFSVTSVSAVESDLPSYSFLVYFLFYIAIGLAVGFLVKMLPRSLISSVSFFISLGFIVLLWMNAAEKLNYSFDESIYCFVFASNIYYLSYFFAKRGNRVERLLQLTMPLIISVGTFAGILFNGNLTFALFYLIVVFIIFRKCGVGPSGFGLLILYLAIPFCLWCLCSQSNLNSIFRFASLKPVSSSSQHALRMDCIRNADLTGKGVGLGEFKSNGIEGLAGPYAVCNIINETGYLGMAFICLVFLAMLLCLFRYSAYSLSADTFASNYTGIFGSYILCQCLFNGLQTVDILPLNGISLPFYSFGINISLILIMSSICYRCMHRKTAKKAPETKKFEDDIEFGAEDGKKED